MAMPDKTSGMLVAIAQNEKRIHDLGYQKGEQSGYESGYNTGYPEGYSSGYNVGSLEGYDSGKEQGYSEGYDQGNHEGFENGYAQGEQSGFENGYQTQYDSFWDAFQQNGTRQNYEHGFAGKGWCTENLKPKYNITPSYASNMFLNCEYKGDLRDLPVKLDFSKSSSMSNLLGYAYGITGIGVVDTRMTANPLAIFTYARALQIVEKFILKSDGSQSLNNAFTQCYELRDIVIEGTIGQTVDFQHSTKLSKASIESIVYALSSTASGKTLTLSAVAVNNNFINDEIVTLFGYKSNWTISLV